MSFRLVALYPQVIDVYLCWLNEMKPRLSPVAPHPVVPHPVEPQPAAPQRRHYMVRKQPGASRALFIAYLGAFSKRGNAKHTNANEPLIILRLGCFTIVTNWCRKQPGANPCSRFRIRARAAHQPRITFIIVNKHASNLFPPGYGIAVVLLL